MRILVIEDHPDLAENIGDYLGARGHTLDFAYDGLGGLHLALENEYDAIVLDVVLPGMSGLDVCRRLRQEAASRVPVLMLTARDTLPDKLAGFDAGTDDYLVKPFALQELEARLSALTQRGSERRRVLQVADLGLDTGTLVARRGRRRLELSPARLTLLRRLMERSPNVVTRQELEDLLWGDAPPEGSVLRTQIYALRREVDADGERPLLHTVRGVGYRLAEDETRDEPRAT